VKRLLIRTLKVLGWCVAVIVLVPLLCFAYYDLTEFQPRRDDIARLIAPAHPDERSPPAMLRKLLLTDQHGDPSWTVTRILLSDLEVPRGMRGGLGWHGTGFLWWQLVRIHLSHEEQLVILCSRSFLGRRAYGYEAGARAYFGRPLDQLTDAELATLVVVARWPSRWNQPEAFNEIAAPRDRLLAHTRSGEPFPY